MVSNSIKAVIAEGRRRDPRRQAAEEAVIKAARTLARRRAKCPPPTPFPKFAGSCPHERARNLFLASLTKAELKQFRAKGFVEVRGKSGNVYRLGQDGGRMIVKPRVGYMCVGIVPERRDGYAVAYPPVFDSLLACLLYIKSDEKELLDRANISWL